MYEFIIILGNSKENIIRKRIERGINEFLSSPIEYRNEFVNETIPRKFIIFSGCDPFICENSQQFIVKDYYDKIDKKKHIIFENKSRNTIENLVNSKNIIDKLCNKVGVIPKIVVCTSTFHINRTILLTKLIFTTYNIPYIIKFIHTEEIVTEQEKLNEEKLVLHFLSEYCKSFLK